MPVKATLDVSVFPNDREVLRLLDIHGFKVYKLRHGQLLVQGSFLKLRAVKAQLQQLLHQDNQPQNNPSPPSLSGHASGTSKASTRMHHTNGTAMHAGNMSPMYAGSRSPITVNAEQFAHVLQSSSPTNSSRDSESPCSLSSPRSGNPSPSLLAPGYGANVTHRRNPSPSRSRSAVSFLMDTDVLRYALCFRKNDIKTILGSNNIQMDNFHQPGEQGGHWTGAQGQEKQFSIEPAQKKHAPIPWDRDPVPVPAAVPDYTSSKYQGDSGRGRTVQRAGSPAPYTPTPSHRGRSHSDSQEKVKEQR
ncbi:uncharacterized protein LOC123490922, partial [Coregonus clupeaformis]|uniref:uncharacterized protein LOC123490922 n=1 Tax=Coregonus clupeaformis TaxID=59861 RepID=UPI001E1C2A36